MRFGESVKERGFADVGELGDAENNESQHTGTLFVGRTAVLTPTMAVCSFMLSAVVRECDRLGWRCVDANDLVKEDLATKAVDRRVMVASMVAQRRMFIGDLQ